MRRVVLIAGRELQNEQAAQEEVTLHYLRPRLEEEAPSFPCTPHVPFVSLHTLQVRRKNPTFHVSLKSIVEAVNIISPRHVVSHSHRPNDLGEEQF